LGYVVYADIGGKLLGRLRYFPLMIFSSIIPAISELHTLNQPEKITMAFERITKYLAVSAIPLFFFCFVFAHPIITVWFGPSYDMSAYTMQILAVGYLLNVLTASVAFVSQGMGNVSYQMWAGLLQTVLNILLGVTLVLQIGYYGAMVATSISLAAGAIYFFFSFRKLLPGSLRVLVKMVRVPLFASALSAVVAYIPLFLIGSWHLERWGLASVMVILTGVFFLAYGFIVRRALYFDEWDGVYILRISPKLMPLKQLFVQDQP
jgi:O-antigen/teichoic acid export membrane protein